ncbi:MAG: UDP-glucose/GDP-mannose dehydrogenase [Actinomycetia bacterium]|nr:UDP-glucose/GDP-mannose dehydrogenase [Actinomycetes bacterium]
MLNSSGSPGSSAAAVLVVGLGEIGRPLLEILRGAHVAAGRDVEDRPFDGVQVLHLCFPYSTDFVSSAARYVSIYEPEVVVVNSTVVPGTTTEIQEKTGVPAVYSPVRGKHAQMADELRRYRKFVAGSSALAVALVEDHFAAAGITTRRMSSPEALELAKLLETTYFGMLVAWAQEMDRFADAVDANYWETTAFLEEIDFLPPVGFQPGYIGGHCVMPNLELLEQVRRSQFIDVMRESNSRRARELQERGLSTTDRLSPRPTRSGRADRD